MPDGSIRFNDSGVIEFPGLTGSNMAMKAKVSKLNGQNLALRLRVSEQGHLVAFFTGKDAGLGFSTKNGGWKSLSRVPVFDSLQTDDVELGMMVRGSQLTVLINGKPVIEKSQSGLPSSGSVAISNLRGVATFRDVQVYVLFQDDSTISSNSSPTSLPSIPSNSTIINKPTSSASVQVPRPASSDSGFVSIFNGVNLNDWKQQAPGHFRVENGAIIADGRAGKSRRSVMYYDGPVNNAQFVDFEFRTQVKIIDGGNSGIYIRTRWKPFDSKTGPRHAPMYPDEWGYEAQISSVGHSNRNKTGSLTRLRTVSNAPVGDGEWFEYHVIANKRQIELIINGKSLTRYDEPEAFNQRKAVGDKLGLQCHEPGYVLFRDLKIKVLN